MSLADKPNVVLPLAASINERGTKGFTNSITSGIDQRKVNSMYEVAKNAMTGKTTLYLVKRPGVSVDAASFGTSGQVAYILSTKPGNTALTAADFWVFSTSGNDIRASNSTGTTTVIVTAAGYAPYYVGKTSISGTETLVVQLKNASNAQRVFYSSAIATFTEITDGDFAALTLRGKMEFIDGWALVMDNMNRIYNSDLNSLSSWQPQNYITKQIVQDLPVGLARLGNQIIAFGIETMEVLVNNGNPSGSPLVSVPSLFQRVGINLSTVNVGQTSYYAISGKKMYFVGRKGGYYSDGVFVYDGSSCERISTDAIDKIISQNNFVYSVHAVALSGKEAIVFGLDLTTATTQRWLVYFPEYNDWFEWNSTVFKPIFDSIYYLGVDANQHKLYAIVPTSDNWTDADINYTWTHQFQLPDNGNQRKFMPYMALKGDTARSAQSISVEFSDDDYQSFSSARTIDMTKPEKSLFRCGSYKGARVVRLSHAGNTEVRLSQFLARIE